MTSSIRASLFLALHTAEKTCSFFSKSLALGLLAISRVDMLLTMSDALVMPNELAACQALIGELAQTIGELQNQNTKLKQESAEQQLTISELLQQAFRKRSERYLEDPNQLQIDFGNTPEVADAADGLADAIQQAETIVAEHKRRKQAAKKPRNEQLPEHLPRYEVEAAVPDDVKHCDQHGERKLIGHDRIETLEFERPKLKVRVTLIPKYACEGQSACGVAEPLRPAALVEGNRYDTSIAAEIITGKYGSGTAASVVAADLSTTRLVRG